MHAFGALILVHSSSSSISASSSISTPTVTSLSLNILQKEVIRPTSGSRRFAITLCTSNGSKQLAPIYRPTGPALAGCSKIANKGTKPKKKGIRRMGRSQILGLYRDFLRNATKITNYNFKNHARYVTVLFRLSQSCGYYISSAHNFTRFACCMCVFASDLLLLTILLYLTVS